MDKKEIKGVDGLVMHRKDGQSGLRLVCQICHEFIEDAELALFIWNNDTGTVWPVHKDCNKSIRDPFDCTMEVGTMLMYLLWNTDIKNVVDYRKWMKIAKSFSS